MRFLKGILGLLVVAAAIILPHRWEASRECGELAGVVNTRVERIHRIAAGMTERNLAEKVLLMADEWDALGEDLAGLEFESAKVMRFQYEYRSHALHASSALRALGRTVKPGKPEDALDRLIAEEDALSSRVTEFCGASSLR
jgi:hypothetical protein